MTARAGEDFDENVTHCHSCGKEFEKDEKIFHFPHIIPMSHGYRWCLPCFKKNKMVPAGKIFCQVVASSIKNDPDAGCGLHLKVPHWHIVYRYGGCVTYIDWDNYEEPLKAE